jgi:hypothetical protein
MNETNHLDSRPFCPNRGHLDCSGIALVNGRLHALDRVVHICDRFRHRDSRNDAVARRAAQLSSMLRIGSGGIDDQTSFGIHGGSTRLNGCDRLSTACNTTSPHFRRRRARACNELGGEIQTEQEEQIVQLKGQLDSLFLHLDQLTSLLDLPAQLLDMVG